MDEQWRTILGTVALFAAIQSLPAQTTAVSNLGQPTASNNYLSIGYLGSSNYSRAFSFTTGASTVAFSSVTIAMQTAVGSASGLSFSLYSGMIGNVPSGFVASLTGNPAPLTVGNYIYSAATPPTLQPGLTYWLVGSASSTTADTSFQLNTTYSISVDSGNLTDWQIGSGFYFNNGGSTWTISSAYTPQFSVQYSAVPEPSTCAALAGLGALGFTAYRRRRWTAG